MKYSERFKQLSAQYIRVIDKIESGIEPERAAELDARRAEIHDELLDLLARSGVTHDRDSVHSIAVRLGYGRTRSGY